MPEQKYQMFYKKILKNQKALQKKINAVRKEKSLEKRLILAKNALDFAASGGTGIYSCDVLENVYLDLARENEIPLEHIQPEKGTFVHVMTTAYSSGGHTRVVERWIGQAPETQKHDLILLEKKKKDPLPALLEENVREKNGTIRCYDPYSPMLERALKLREAAMHYEYVILHIHPNDPIALIAFGTPEFTRPVIVFNHADHIFWAGVSIADMVAELSSGGLKTSREQRLVKKSFRLGIPVENKEMLLPSQEEARKKLNIPADKKAVLLSGHSGKLRPAGKSDITRVLDDMLRQNPDVLLYVIGPSAKEKHWKRLMQTAGGRLIMPGQVDYDKEYPLYLSASDFVIDSYPVGGGTAMIDAVLAGKPVLSLETAIPRLDYLAESQSNCLSEEELLSKSFKVLNDPAYAEKLQKETADRLYADLSIENWGKKIDRMLSETPQKHSLHHFDSSTVPAAAGDKEVLTSIWMNEDFVKGLTFKKARRFIFSFRWKKDKKLLRILGLELINKAGS